MSAKKLMSDAVVEDNMNLAADPVVAQHLMTTDDTWVS